MIMRSLHNYFCLLAAVWGKRVIKWLDELSDTSPGSERGPQTGRSGMCFLLASGVIQGRFLVPSWHTHTHTLSCQNEKLRLCGDPLAPAVMWVTLQAWRTQVCFSQSSCLGYAEVWPCRLHTNNPQWWSGWPPVTSFAPVLNFKCSLFFLFFASTSSLSILLCSQDEINQIMETNLWLRHVSLWCMTVQMESWARAWGMDPAVCHTWFFRAGLTSWIIHGGELFKHSSFLSFYGK